ncbi:hypothetical protein [Streptomyces justiciae]|uniref:hypothetical protein n=1 Tax=Streptomyces justiciae TaxID=2780140 RepID=UPI0018815264|nr:hypothetical protein [Streptomyces justiciae]MBE8477471.1 hypothetical protein [Streptomyces justiciae]
MSNHGTVTRQDRVTVPSPGCLLAIMAPLLAVVLAAAVLMVMYNRQESANDRNEKEALQKTATQARLYAHEVLENDEYPGEAAVRDIAEQHDGRLTSYTRSSGSLTTTVRFFAEYKDTSMFGVSYSRAHRCYSVKFRKNTGGELRETTTPLEKCGPA